MRLLRLIGKILVFPLLTVVTALQWIFSFLISFASVIFNLLAGLFILIAVLLRIFNVATWTEALRPFLAGITLFMIPIIGQSLVTITVVFREGLYDFVRS